MYVLWKDTERLIKNRGGKAYLEQSVTRKGYFYGTLRSSSEGRVYWLERKELKMQPLAHDMNAMIELFDHEEKREFYYFPNSPEREHLIL